MSHPPFRNSDSFTFSSSNSNSLSLQSTLSNPWSASYNRLSNRFGVRSPTNHHHHAVIRGFDYLAASQQDHQGGQGGGIISGGGSGFDSHDSSNLTDRVDRVGRVSAGRGGGDSSYDPSGSPNGGIDEQDQLLNLDIRMRTADNGSSQSLSQSPRLARAERQRAATVTASELGTETQTQRDTYTDTATSRATGQGSRWEEVSGGAGAGAARSSTGEALGLVQGDYTAHMSTATFRTPTRTSTPTISTATETATAATATTRHRSGSASVVLPPSLSSNHIRATSSVTAAAPAANPGNSTTNNQLRRSITHQPPGVSVSFALDHSNSPYSHRLEASITPPAASSTSYFRRTYSDLQASTAASLSRRPRPKSRASSYERGTAVVAAAARASHLSQLNSRLNSHSNSNLNSSSSSLSSSSAASTLRSTGSRHHAASTSTHLSPSSSSAFSQTRESSIRPRAITISTPMSHPNGPNPLYQLTRPPTTTTSAATSESAHHQSQRAPTTTSTDDRNMDLNIPSTIITDASPEIMLAHPVAGSALDLPSHMYRSFLTGSCADVRITIKQWNVAYRFHKVVLVQAGFFDSLFLGGFSEDISEERGEVGGNKTYLTAKATSSSAAVQPQGRPGGKHIHKHVRDGLTQLDLTFDDPNITRAAFEICISRLYSHYPKLDIPAHYLPSSSCPLTPGFPHPPVPLPDPTPMSTSKPMPKQIGPPSTILAKPQLILSLLATSIYLGQNEVLKEALALVLRSISPWSIAQYLDFAVGFGSAWSDEEEWEGDEDVDADADEGRHGAKTKRNRSAVGFENLAEKLTGDQGTYGERQSRPQGHDSIKKEEDNVTPPFIASTSSIPEEEHQKISAVSTDHDDDEPDMDTDTFDDNDNGDDNRYFYGFAGDKIGQACAAWLCRWGSDLLDIEEVDQDFTLSSTTANAISRLSLGATTPAQTTQKRPAAALRIWGPGGLSPDWIRAIISSDAFFISSEAERYRFAKRVLHFRRQTKITNQDDTESMIEEEEDDEAECMEELFSSGIYYSHMPFDQLSSMSSDIDPETGLPYVPLNVLQAALWASSDMQTRICAYKPNGTGVVVKNADHGLAVTTAQVLEDIKAINRTLSPRRASRRLTSIAGRSSGRSTPQGNDSPIRSTFVPGSKPFTSPLDKRYWPVPSDSTIRIGDVASGLFYSSQLLPDLGPTSGMMATTPKPADDNTPKISSGDPYFGFGTSARRGREIEPEMDPSSSVWAVYEPFRFAVEFWNVDGLGEKERAYSHTQFHAGSFFNVYIQTIKKKDNGVQLGIYLHRQSMLEPLPAPSTPTSPTTGKINSPMTSPTMTPGSLSMRRTHSASATTPASLPGPGSPPDAHPHLLDDDVTTQFTTAAATIKHAPPSPYRDPRRASKVYFSISCASALGTALTRFSSGPDLFTVSQSWGWKSSSLRSQEYLADVVTPNERLGEGVLGWVSDVPGGIDQNHLRSLRATVVMGVL